MTRPKKGEIEAALLQAKRDGYAMAIMDTSPQVPKGFSQVERDDLLTRQRIYAEMEAIRKIPDP